MQGNTPAPYNSPMAEDQGKEEERFDFTGVGEAASRGRRFPVLPLFIGIIIVGVIAAVAVIFAVGGFGNDRGILPVVAPT